MEKIFTRVFSVALGVYLIMAPARVSAATYYVDSAGNDANSGTITAPFRSTTKGVSMLSAGDTLYVRAGTYSSFTVSRSGTATSPITISGYNNEFPTISGGIGIRLSGVSYVKVQGFEVTGATGNGIKRMGGVVIQNGNNNTIENCRIHDNNIDSPNGIKVEGASSNNRLIYNTVYSNGGPDGGSGIRFYNPTSTQSTGNEIGWNTVYNNIGTVGNSDGISVVDRIVYTNIHDNVVYGNGDDGIDVWNTQYNTIVNNKSYSHVIGDGNGFKLGGYDANGIGGNNTIRNNHAFSNKYNGFDSNGSGGNQYEGNQSYNNGSSTFSNNAWGFIDTRRSGDTRPSSMVNNNSYNNKTANYARDTYTTTFSGNTETPPTSPTPIPSPTPMPWTTIEADYSTWLSHYLQQLTGFANGDFSNNGIVDGVDYLLWAIKYGN